MVYLSAFENLFSPLGLPIEPLGIVVAGTDLFGLARFKLQSFFISSSLKISISLLFHFFARYFFWTHLFHLNDEPIAGTPWNESRNALNILLF